MHVSAGQESAKPPAEQCPACQGYSQGPRSFSTSRWNGAWAFLLVSGKSGITQLVSLLPPPPFLLLSGASLTLTRPQEVKEDMQEGRAGHCSGPFPAQLPLGPPFSKAPDALNSSEGLAEPHDCDSEGQGQACESPRAAGSSGQPQATFGS